MSIHSMTGYATATARAGGWVVNVEVRSVNHRGLDTRLTVPRACAWMEPQITEMIRAQLSRGRVEVRVDLEVDEASAERSLRFFDAARFAAVCQELQQLAAAQGLADSSRDVKLADVTAFKHLFEATGGLEVDPENPALMAAVESALTKLTEARAREGRGIAEDLGAHLRELRTSLDALAALLPGELEAFRARLRQRVADAVEAFGAGGVDDERLAQELAYYADKGDIGEELQRAASHINRLEDLLLDDSGAVLATDTRPEACGKTVDFYLQELIRETNTMGSKSNSARGTDLVIAMKATIERMREQAANIE